MSVDLLFTTHNRLEFTQASFDALLMNTNWELVRRLLVIDDNSSDGTYDYMSDIVRDVPVATKLFKTITGGPASSMNLAIDKGDQQLLAKIDNDVIVCPTWLDTMLDVMTHNSHIDALGMEPGFGAPVQPLTTKRSYVRARWIGGVGVIRRDLFIRGRRLQPVERWFGWTEFQRRFARPAWITPALPVFLLDHLKFEPWASLREEYIRKGWQRRWPDEHLYPPEMSGYYEWWVQKQLAVQT